MSFAAHAFGQRHVRDRRGELDPTNTVGRAPLLPACIVGKIVVRSSSRPAGLSTQNGHHGGEPGSASARPLSTQWLSDDRIAEARRVWSRAYGRVISQDEAIEILMNVRRLAEVLLRAEEEKKP